MAFSCRPKVIVLDEPTTGLDVTTQAHVLNTIRDLVTAHRAAAVYVTHDLAVVADLADRIAVMYAGRLVEVGPAAELFAGASHPYTRRLLHAVICWNDDDECDPRFIGRDVRDCHPKESLPTLERILGEFKAGRRDLAEGWREISGRFKLLRYIAIRDEAGDYKGILEVSIDLQDYRGLEGEQALPGW